MSWALIALLAEDLMEISGSIGKIWKKGLMGENYGKGPEDCYGVWIEKDGFWEKNAKSGLKVEKIVDICLKERRWHGQVDKFEERNDADIEEWKKKKKKERGDTCPS